MTEKQIKHVAKIIDRNLSFTNGWNVSEKSYYTACFITAKKIAKYLKRTSKTS